jgi:NADH:ubiquinone oxidoreductase subunit F (NADH-binding)
LGVADSRHRQASGDALGTRAPSSANDPSYDCVGAEIAMMQSAIPAPLLSKVHHLLGHPSDLKGHIESHGPLNVALGRTSSWQEGLAASLKASGLTGRGGGAFPASIKLALARSGGAGGTVVVNAMEGEPASDKDKVLLGKAPHLVLDGAQYMASLCQAHNIVVCVPIDRDDVASAVGHAMAERTRIQYARVREELARPPDRFIAGEESALTNWIDTGQSLPVFRPDKGTPLRLGNGTALVHNAETLAHVALIARNGPGPFRARGMSEEPGTCLVTISGAVTHPGVVEVDRGTPLWDIAALSQPFESVQGLLVGGYGGTWVGQEHFGTPYASFSLRTIGATAGVGVIVVLGQSSCGLAESTRIARYLADQSAGQCGPCVYGLPAIADDLARLTYGQGDEYLVARLHRRLHEVSGRGACRHPDGAVNMVRSALAVFAGDIEAHGRGEPCPYWPRLTTLRFPRPVGL